MDDTTPNFGGETPPNDLIVEDEMKNGLEDYTNETVEDITNTIKNTEPLNGEKNEGNNTPMDGATPVNGETTTGENTSSTVNKLDSTLENIIGQSSSSSSYSKITNEGARKGGKTSNKSPRKGGKKAGGGMRQQVGPYNQNNGGRRSGKGYGKSPHTFGGSKSSSKKGKGNNKKGSESQKGSGKYKGHENQKGGNKGKGPGKSKGYEPYSDLPDHREKRDTNDPYSTKLDKENGDMVPETNFDFSTYRNKDYGAYQPEYHLNIGKSGSNSAFMGPYLQDRLANIKYAERHEDEKGQTGQEDIRYPIGMMCRGQTGETINILGREPEGEDLPNFLEERMDEHPSKQHVINEILKSTITQQVWGYGTVADGTPGKFPYSLSEEAEGFLGLTMDDESKTKLKTILEYLTAGVIASCVHAGLEEQLKFIRYIQTTLCVLNTKIAEHKFNSASTDGAMNQLEIHDLNFEAIYTKFYKGVIHSQSHIGGALQHGNESMNKFAGQSCGFFGNCTRDNPELFKSFSEIRFDLTKREYQDHLERGWNFGQFETAFEVNNNGTFTNDRMEELYQICAHCKQVWLTKGYSIGATNCHVLKCQPANSNRDALETVLGWNLTILPIVTAMNFNSSSWTELNIKNGWYIKWNPLKIPSSEKSKMKRAVLDCRKWAAEMNSGNITEVQAREEWLRLRRYVITGIQTFKMLPKYNADWGRLANCLCIGHEIVLYTQNSEQDGRMTSKVLDYHGKHAYPGSIKTRNIHITAFDGTPVLKRKSEISELGWKNEPFLWHNTLEAEEKNNRCTWRGQFQKIHNKIATYGIQNIYGKGVFENSKSKQTIKPGVSTGKRSRVSITKNKNPKSSTSAINDNNHSQFNNINDTGMNSVNTNNANSNNSWLNRDHNRQANRHTNTNSSSHNKSSESKNIDRRPLYESSGNNNTEQSTNNGGSESKKVEVDLKPIADPRKTVYGDSHLFDGLEIPKNAARHEKELRARQKILELDGQEVEQSHQNKMRFAREENLKEFEFPEQVQQLTISWEKKFHLPYQREVMKVGLQKGFESLKDVNQDDINKTSYQVDELLDQGRVFYNKADERFIIMKNEDHYQHKFITEASRLEGICLKMKMKADKAMAAKVKPFEGTNIWNTIDNMDVSSVQWFCLGCAAEMKYEHYFVFRNAQYENRICRWCAPQCLSAEHYAEIMTNEVPDDQVKNLDKEYLVNWWYANTPNKIGTRPMCLQQRRFFSMWHQDHPQMKYQFLDGFNNSFLNEARKVVNFLSDDESESDGLEDIMNIVQTTNPISSAAEDDDIDDLLNIQKGTSRNSDISEILNERPVKSQKTSDNAHGKNGNHSSLYSTHGKNGNQSSMNDQQTNNESFVQDGNDFFDNSQTCFPTGSGFQNNSSFEEQNNLPTNDNSAQYSSPRVTNSYFGQGSETKNSQVETNHGFENSNLSSGTNFQNRNSCGYTGTSLGTNHGFGNSSSSSGTNHGFGNSSSSSGPSHGFGNNYPSSELNLGTGKSNSNSSVANSNLNAMSVNVDKAFYKAMELLNQNEQPSLGNININNNYGATAFPSNTHGGSTTAFPNNIHIGSTTAFPNNIHGGLTTASSNNTHSGSTTVVSKNTHDGLAAKLGAWSKPISDLKLSNTVAKTPTVEQMRDVMHNKSNNQKGANDSTNFGNVDRRGDPIRKNSSKFANKIDINVHIKEKKQKSIVEIFNNPGRETVDPEFPKIWNDQKDIDLGDEAPVSVEWIQDFTTTHNFTSNHVQDHYRIYSNGEVILNEKIAGKCASLDYLVDKYNEAMYAQQANMLSNAHGGQTFASWAPLLVNDNQTLDLYNEYTQYCNHVVTLLRHRKLFNHPWQNQVDWFMQQEAAAKNKQPTAIVAQNLKVFKWVEETTTKHAASHGAMTRKPSCVFENEEYEKSLNKILSDEMTQHYGQTTKQAYLKPCLNCGILMKQFAVDPIFGDCNNKSPYQPSWMESGLAMCSFCTMKEETIRGHAWRPDTQPPSCKKQSIKFFKTTYHGKNKAHYEGVIRDRKMVLKLRDPKVHVICENMVLKRLLLAFCRYSRESKQ